MERYSYSIDVDYILSKNPLIYGLHSFREPKRPYTLKDEDFYELCNAYIDLYESPGWDFITYNSRGEAEDAMPEVVKLAREELLISLMDDLAYKLGSIYSQSLSIDLLPEAGKISTTLYDENNYQAEVSIYLDTDGFADDTYSTYEAYQIVIVFNTAYLRNSGMKDVEFKFKPGKDRLDDIIKKIEDLYYKGINDKNK